MEGHFLTRFFSPQGVALFGASAHTESVGGVLFENLSSASFSGDIIPINPKYQKVGGLHCYKELGEVSQNLDLAVIATPAKTVPGILEACGVHGIRAAVILSAGFREAGEAGKKLEEEVLKTARRHAIRLIGPNSLGILRPKANFNATFYRGKAKPGNLALVSQSGALCSSILDWAQVHDIGFSTLVSLGTSADVDFGDVLDFLSLDVETRAILLYIEGIRHSRGFMSALRAAAQTKPVFALKAGKHASGSKAAVSHSGALVGSDEVFAAAFARAGVVPVASVDQLFAAAATFASKKRCRRDPLVIVTNGGGPGVLAADAATDRRVPLAELAPKTLEGLNQFLPPAWSRGNPIDLLGDATPQQYAKALEICDGDPGIGGILVILTPQAMTQPQAVAEAVRNFAKRTDKPVIACWMGGPQVQPGRLAFIKDEIPCFDSPEQAVEAYGFLVAYRIHQEMLLQTPGPLTDAKAADLAGAKMIVGSVPKGEGILLDTVQSKALLSAFQIPITQAYPARSPGEALSFAEEIGFPVAMKVFSPRITHKTEVEGIELNIRDGASVRGAYHRLVERVKKIVPDAEIQGVTVEKMIVRPHGREISVGVVKDPIFGPVINFGLGGTLVEVLKDHAVALPPLNEVIIRHFTAKTQAAHYLKEFRNFPPAHFAGVLNILLRVSEMACEIPQIVEMDLNPVVVDEEGAVVVDARVLLDTTQAHLQPYDHLAIHPYPGQCVRTWQLPDGTDLLIRPIRPEDAQIEKSFVKNLSPKTKYFRFLSAIQELTQPMLVRFTQIDYDREMAFIAVVGEGSSEREIAVGRYVTYPDGKTCEFAIVVGDEWQGKGIGHQIMLDLIRVAQARGLKTMVGDIFSENKGMIEMAKNLGFTVNIVAEEPEVSQAVKILNP